jgi:hypothetical protein
LATLKLGRPGLGDNPTTATVFAARNNLQMSSELGLTKFMVHTIAFFAASGADGGGEKRYTARHSKRS